MLANLVADAAMLASVSSWGIRPMHQSILLFYAVAHIASVQNAVNGQSTSPAMLHCLT